MDTLEQVHGMLTEFAKIDLGEKYEDRYGCCLPETPKNKVYYPSVYIAGDVGKRDLSTIPEEGKAVVEYRVKERSVREDDSGKKRQTTVLEIRSFEPDKSKDSKGKENAAGESAKLVKELQASMEEVLTRFEAPLGARERDGAGRYVANETGGADPLTMRQAYGPSNKETLKTAAAAAGGALLAGGAARGVRAVRRNYGGPGVPIKESLKAAAGDAKRAWRKRWAGRLAV
jgi:hypothetical protein